MSFAWPQLLWLLLVPAALLAWELTHRRKAAAVNGHPKILRVEAGANSVRVSRDNAPLRSAPVVRGWLSAGLVLLVLALARPQWGRLELPVFDQSREILLAVDLSRSMLTPDVKPARLDRAKLLIQSLLEKLAGERVGLVVFSGTAFLQSPLSADYEILREFLPALGPGFLPEGGTNYRALIDTALDAFGDTATADRFLIILSDGEATEDEWRARMPELTKRNIRVIGLGVGTAAGAMIPDGSGGFVKDERGAVVLSRLESRTLQELAESTNGVYRDASSWVDLAVLLRETVEAGQKGEFVEKNTIRMVERFQWPLAFALWCFGVSLCYEFPVRPRPRAIGALRAPERRAGRREKEASLAAVSAFFLLLSPLSLLLAVGFAPASAHGAASLATPPAKGSPAKKAAEPSAISKIVGRLSATEKPNARDWAELARETVIWGSQLKTERQDVPEGPVRDALGAVDLGHKLDAKTADWPKLRRELEALLEKTDPPPEEQPKDQQDQDQQKDQQEQQEDQQKSDSQQNQQNQKNRDKQQQNQSENQNQKQEQKPPGESAFGDMKKKEEPPPPTDMQKVGGEKKDESPEPADPALALPMQKLEQLKAQDSPAHLFQLMEGDKKQPTKKTGKDW